MQESVNLSTEPTSVPISGNGALPEASGDRATDQGDRATNDEVAAAYQCAEKLARRMAPRFRFSQLDADGVANDAVTKAWERWRRDWAVPLTGVACACVKFGFLTKRRHEARYAVTGEAWEKMAATIVAPSGGVDGGEIALEAIGRPEVVAVELAKAGASIRQLEKIGVTYYQARCIVKEHGPHGGKRPVLSPIQRKARNRAAADRRARAANNEQSVAECPATVPDATADPIASDEATSNPSSEAAA